MSRIRAKDTKPEMMIRRGLHARGLRYRLHVRQLPGRPDLVFPRRRAVIFVHGCFWHGHDCPLFKRPASRQEFWDAKIARNRENDVRAAESLKQAGWRMMTVWECALRGPSRLGIADVLARIESWLDGQEAHSELRSTES